MADNSPQTYVRTDPVTGEKSERVVFDAADAVAAKFAGYRAKSTRGTKAAAKTADAKPAEVKAADTPAANESK